jgi:PilZ domain
MAIEARRHNPRTKLNGTSPIKFYSGTTGVVLDVSEGGLRFETSVPLDAKASVRFWLGSEHPTEGTGEVAWSNDTKTIGGLHFESLSPEMRLQIRNWIDGLETLPAARRSIIADTTTPASAPAIARSMGATSRTGMFGGASAAAAAPSKIAPIETVTVEIPVSEMKTDEVKTDKVQTVKTPATEALHNSFSSLSTSTLGLGRPAAASPSDVGRLLDETPSKSTPSATLNESSSVESTPPQSEKAASDEQVNVSPPAFNATTETTAAVRASGNGLSMFPMERTSTGGFVTVKESDHRTGVTILVVLIVLAAGAAAFVYFRPVQARELMNRAQGQIEQYIHMVRSGHSGNQQPASQAPPHTGTAMANPADNPEVASMPPGFQQGSAGFQQGPAGSGTATPGAAGSDAADGSAWSNMGSAAPPMGSGAGSAGAAVSGPKSTTGNDGSSDLALAQSYLQPSSSAAQKQEGVKLLWGATEKGNVDAEIQLADLYEDGIAVPKSCVQARILLKAAAATNPTAAQSKLDDLDKANCN